MAWQYDANTGRYTDPSGQSYSASALQALNSSGFGQEGKGFELFGNKAPTQKAPAGMTGAEMWGVGLGAANLGLQTIGAIANYNQAEQQWKDTAGLRAAEKASLETQTQELGSRINLRKRNAELASSGKSTTTL